MFFCWGGGGKRFVIKEINELAKICVFYIVHGYAFFHRERCKKNVILRFHEPNFR